MDKYGEFKFFKAIGSIFTKLLPKVCSIGAHIGANVALPGIGSAIVFGATYTLKSAAIGYTISKLIEFKGLSTSCNNLIVSA